MKRTKHQIQLFKFHKKYLLDFKKYLLLHFNGNNDCTIDGDPTNPKIIKDDCPNHVICRVRCAQGDDTFNNITFRTIDIIKNDLEWDSFLIGKNNIMLYAIENIFQNKLDYIRIIDLDVLRLLNSVHEKSKKKPLGQIITNYDSSAFRSIDLSKLPKIVNNKNLIIAEYGKRKIDDNNITFEGWLQNA